MRKSKNWELFNQNLKSIAQHILLSWSKFSKYFLNNSFIDTWHYRVNSKSHKQQSYATDSVSAITSIQSEIDTRQTSYMIRSEWIQILLQESNNIITLLYIHTPDYHFIIQYNLKNDTIFHSFIHQYQLSIHKDSQKLLLLNLNTFSFSNKYHTNLKT